MSKQTDQGGQKSNRSQWEINLLLGSYQGLSSFEDYQAYTFQHHHPLIRSFFPEKFCWKVQTILHPYKTFCSILPNLSIQFGWLNSQNSVSLNLMRCPSKFYSIHSKQHFTSGFFLFKDASHFPDPQNLWCTLRCQVEERVFIQTIRGAFKNYFCLLRGGLFPPFPLSFFEYNDCPLRGGGGPQIPLKSRYFRSKNSIFCLFLCIFSSFWTIIWPLWPIFNLI